jgi:DNA-binding response OmpR family regulator
MPIKKILLMEDDPIISADMQGKLETWGYDVCLAADGAEVLSFCSKQTFDLTLINFNQETLSDGMALAKILRGRYEMPISFITGARRIDIQASKNYHPHHPILYKPFTYRQLQHFINGVH